MPKAVPFLWFSIIDFKVSPKTPDKIEVAGVFQKLQNRINIPQRRVNGVVRRFSRTVFYKVGNQALFAVSLESERIFLASSNLPVTSIKPGREMKVSLPQGSNQK